MHPGRTTSIVCCTLWLVSVFVIAVIGGLSLRDRPFYDSIGQDWGMLMLVLGIVFFVLGFIACCTITFEPPLPPEHNLVGVNNQPCTSISAPVVPGNAPPTDMGYRSGASSASPSSAPPSCPSPSCPTSCSSPSSPPD